MLRRATSTRASEPATLPTANAGPAPLWVTPTTTSTTAAAASTTMAICSPEAVP